MDSVSLPSDNSDAELLLSDVESVAGEETTESCCKAGCLAAINESQAFAFHTSELQTALTAGSKAQKEMLQFNCLKHWGQDSGPEETVKGPGWRKFKFLGLPLCVTAACQILKLPIWKFKSLTKQIKDGKMLPDQSLKQSQIQKEKFATDKANVLLSWLHQNVAENLAESNRVNDDNKADNLTLQRQAARSAGLTLARDPRPVHSSNNELFQNMVEESQQVKWLPPGTTLTEMRDLAQTFVPDSSVSYSTFISCYQASWASKLKVRAEGQHSKCTTCCRLKEYRRQCHAASDINRVQQEYSTHIADVMADRKWDAQLNLRACQSMGSVPGVVPPQDTLLSISMDAMDCAKFKLPRHLQASKEFQNSWRPELTMIAAIVEGVTEHYVLADQDMVKNANLQCTIIGLVLQETLMELQKRGGVDLPRNLRIHTDNASGEGKNQTVFYLASWMVKRRLFDSVTLSQFRVGHSHGKPDQRFSEVRWALSQSPVLETPGHFGEAIRESVKPREGRSLKVHHMGASLEFKYFFEKLELKTSGHTQTKGKTEKQLEACHVFSFYTRDTFSQRRKNTAIQELDAKYGLPPRPDDIIMCCQLHVASNDDSQVPFVFAAASDFDHLPPAAQVAAAPRSEFSIKQIKEFEKTAWKISQPPWNMDMGSAYLLKLVTENKENSGLEWIPPDMPFLLTGQRATFPKKTEPASVFTNETFGWNHTSPAPVTVTRPRTRLTRKFEEACPEHHASSSSRPKATSMGGAPKTLFGREGAPDRIAPEPSKVKKLKRPSAAPQLQPSKPASLPLPSDAEEQASQPLPSEADEIFSPPHPPSLALPSDAETLPRARDTAPSQPASALPSEPETLPTSPQRRPAAAKSKAAAAKARQPKAKAVPKPKGQPKKIQYGRLPKPPGVQLGCHKCRFQGGCTRCRTLAGLVLNEERTAWIFQP